MLRGYVYSISYNHAVYFIFRFIFHVQDLLFERLLYKKKMNETII